MNRIKATLQRELKEAGWHSRGYLPHFDGGEIAQTITFRLADSLPQRVIESWKRELKNDPPGDANADAVLRRRIDHYLDQGCGRCDLRNARVATMVQESLLHFDGSRIGFQPG